MSYEQGYNKALENVYRILTNGEGRTESYEAAVAYIEDELK